MSRSMTSPSFMYLFLCCIAFVASKLRIMAPMELREKLNISIATVAGNYGRIPYGFYTRGKIFYDHPENPDEKEYYSCKEGKSLVITNQYQYDYYPIFLIYEGNNCSYVQMTRIVEQKGGRMALIISSYAENETEIKEEILPDDGTGGKVSIPTLMISQKHGDIITKYIQEHPEQSVYLEIDFPTRQAESVSIDLFFNVGNVEAYRFMSDFYYFYKLISNHTNFTPHYLTYQNNQTDLSEEEKKGNCISDGRYCLPPYQPPETNAPAEKEDKAEKEAKAEKNGKAFIEEGLFQSCVYKASKEKKDKLTSFFSFISNFNKQCTSNLLESVKNTCGRGILRSLDIKEEDITDCVKKSDDSNTNSNKILMADNRAGQAIKIDQTPLISVNTKKIYGTLYAPNIFQVVCSSFIDQPQGCKDYYKPEAVVPRLSWFQITLIIIATILANVFIIYICRRYIHERLQDKVSRESVEYTGAVDKSIDRYFSFKDPVQSTSK